MQPRLAVIVHAAKDSGNVDVFRDRALAAAAAGAFTNGYLATGDDCCDHALFVSIDAKEFYSRLQSESAEPYVDALLDALEEASSKFYGTLEIPVRLFMEGPSILAFAAGAVLPHGSKYVPFDPALAPPMATDLARKKPDPSIVAIVDGDDVGAEAERHLLSGDLEKAVDYSAHVSRSIENLVIEITRAPGISLISQGGDRRYSLCPWGI